MTSSRAKFTFLHLQAPTQKSWYYDDKMLQGKKPRLWPATSSHAKCGVSNFVFYILTFYHRNIIRIVVLVLVRLCILYSLKMEHRRRTN